MISHPSQPERLLEHPFVPSHHCYLEGYRFDATGLKVWISQKTDGNYVCVEFAFENFASFLVEIDPFAFDEDTKAEDSLQDGFVSIASESELLSRIRSAAHWIKKEDLGADLHYRFFAREFCVHVVTDLTPPAATSLSSPPPGAIFGARLS